MIFPQSHALMPCINSFPYLLFIVYIYCSLASWLTLRGRFFIPKLVANNFQELQLTTQRKCFE